MRASLRLVPFLVALGLVACDSTTDPSTRSTSEDELRVEAVDPTAPGPLDITSAEYRFASAVDSAVLAGRATEVWARVYRPKTLTGDHPVLVFLHGNHGTCGRGQNPRIDSSVQYTTSGTCPPGYVVTPNHEGYGYLAERLASWGYVVVSINANRGITAAGGVAGDFGLNLARGRLVLRHLALLAAWNKGTTTTPSPLGTSFKGKLDLSNVGMLGHSRGGEGIRAAYNQYKDAGSPWPQTIGTPIGFKGLFEIGPVDGQTDRVLDATGTAWDVLLPMCDGDVSDLSGMRPFDRMLAAADEDVATPKGMFAIWGTNHNFFNTEWQESDASGCSGTGHKPLFSTSESSSARQQQAGAYAALAFFRAHVGKAATPKLAEALDPKFELPKELRAITRVERAYVDTLDEARTRKLSSFAQNPVPPSTTGVGVTVRYGRVSEHDDVLSAARVKWTKSGPGAFFEVKLPTNVDASAFDTIGFRTSLAPRASAPPSAVSFGVRLQDASGAVSNTVSIRDYVELAGYGGHVTLESVRLPLGAFGGVDLGKLAAVRFVFDETGADEVYLTDLRVEKPSPTGKLPVVVGPPPSTSIGDGFRRDAETEEFLSGNAVVSTRRIDGGVELEVESEVGFPVSNELAVLRVGEKQVSLGGRYSDEVELRRMVFTISEAEYAAVEDGSVVHVEYGQRKPTKRWRLGGLRKLNR